MKKTPLGIDLKDLLKQRAKDRLYNFLLSDGEIRGAVVHSTLMVKEIRANFDLGILESYILGEAYSAMALLSSNLQKNDRMAMKIGCSGQIEEINVEANAQGEVRGYLKNTNIKVDSPLNDFNLSPFFGAGFITLTKYLEDAKQPYEGRVMIEYGSIAKDLANYFLTSEQIPTAFLLSVKFDKNGKIKGAGGVFLQALPGASIETIKNLENLMLNIKSPGDAFAENIPAEEYIKTEFSSLNPNIIGNHRVEFFCRCSKKQMTTYLKMLPKKDLAEIRKNGPFPLELVCHNCNSKYHFTQSELKSI